MKRILPLLPLPALLLSLCAAPALAQSRAAREAGSSAATVTVSPAMAFVIGAVGSGIAAELAQGSLRSSTGQAIPAEVQYRVLAILKGGEGAGELAETLRSRGVAPRLAGRLASSLTGLFSSPSPDRYRDAVGALNAVLASEPAALRRDPPAEFLAVQAVLVRLAAGVASAPTPF
jgi:hypothetical protein